MASNLPPGVTDAMVEGTPTLLEDYEEEQGIPDHIDELLRGDLEDWVQDVMRWAYDRGYDDKKADEPYEPQAVNTPRCQACGGQGTMVVEEGLITCWSCNGSGSLKPL